MTCNSVDLLNSRKSEQFRPEKLDRRAPEVTLGLYDSKLQALITDIVGRRRCVLKRGTTQLTNYFLATNIFKTKFHHDHHNFKTNYSIPLRNLIKQIKQ